METSKKTFLDYFTVIPTNTFGKELTQLLANNTEEVTKETLAAILQTDVERIAEFEKGIRTPNALQIIAMMKAFKVNPVKYIKSALNKQKYHLQLR